MQWMSWKNYSVFNSIKNGKKGKANSNLQETEDILL